MTDYTVRRIDDMQGPFRGAFKLARAELGVEAFGMAVIDLPPNTDAYPEHDHSHDDQEEVFLALRGAGVLEVEGERVVLDPDTMVRVGPGARRRVLPGEQAMRVLVLGGVPGRAYEPPEFSKPETSAQPGR